MSFIEMRFSMGISFNADEVMEMAIQIEKNGRSFYLHVADIHQDDQLADFFEKLADMENSHIKTFQKFHEEFSSTEKEGQVFDPDNQASMYLAVMANTHGGEGDPQITETLTGKETLEDILEIALNLEKKSILFYLGLKDLVSKKRGKDKVDQIIDEEKKHIVQLSEVLQNIRES
jgi:rubrerythrin